MKVKINGNFYGIKPMNKEGNWEFIYTEKMEKINKDDHLLKKNQNKTSVDTKNKKNYPKINRKKISQGKELQDRISLVNKRKRLRNSIHRYKSAKKHKKLEKPGVSIITCTNRHQFKENIFANFQNQKYDIKELIIVLNKNDIDINEWKKKASQYNDVKILRLDESQPLGACLNFAISEAKYSYISKFDDDDYYAAEYLGDIMDCFKYTDADIVGKGSFYIYFEESKTLAVNSLSRENCYTNFIAGSTITAKKEVFDKVKFVTDRVGGSDTQFKKDCIANHFKIYTADRFNYVAHRRPNVQEHTWKIADKEWLKTCKIIGKISNYKGYVTV